MQLTLHATRPTLHGASRLGQAMPVWLVKTQRAPSRHCKDVGVYGVTTTAMHDMSTSHLAKTLSISRAPSIRLRLLGRRFSHLR